MDLLSLIKSPEHEVTAIEKLVSVLSTYAANLNFVDLNVIAKSVVNARYDGMKESDILEVTLLNARSYIERHYQYSTFCARLFNKHTILNDVKYVLNLESIETESGLLAKGLRHAKRCSLLDHRLLDGRFDLDRLEAAIVPERSNTLDLLAIQTLYDRYFMHDQLRRFETVQTLWMRVAMGLAVLEEDPTHWAIEFYNVLSTKDYMASTPTLFNAGTKRPQLSSCYLTSIDDDLGLIYDGLKDNALLSKWAGGLGNDWSRVRSLNAHIAGTNGKSQGTIPFLKVANDGAVAVNQCFAPSTELYVNGQVKHIADVRKGDLVLGISGQYREVLDVMEYEQTDPMVELTNQYDGQDPVQVTDAHPFYTLRNGQANWIDVGLLTTDDKVAQVIPTEIVPLVNIKEYDLEQLGHDVINHFGRIPEELKHLPLEQGKLLLKGLLDTAQIVTRKEQKFVEIVTANDSSLRDTLVDIRYQLLRHGVPSRLGESDSLRILTAPLSPAIADLFNIEPCANLDYEVIDNHIFVSVLDIKPINPVEKVYDLIVEGDESYMLTSGLAHNGGKRKGAACAYLTTWHLDIEEFLELRKNTGDDRRRTHDMNTANWIPDEFMIRVFNDQPWTLFTPNEVPELNELYGAEFTEQYRYYEENAKNLNLLHKVVSAKDLWRKMLSMLFETGHPWITFKDPCNIRSPQSHVGIVRSSNLCCIAADQRVVTDHGIVTITELYANQREPVIAGRGHTAQASAMLLPRPNAPMVKIHTKEGYTHKVTPDHRVWVVGKGIVEAQHLVAGDLVELQQTSLFGDTHNPRLALLAGLLAGDGTFTNSGVRLDFWKGKTTDIAFESLTAASDLLVDTNIDLGKRANFDIQMNVTEQKSYFHSSSLAKILANEGVTKETKLAVPEFVWKGDRDTVSAYLRGLFITDGTVSASGDVTVASLSSIDRKLIEDVQILLINYGIKSSINKMRDSELRMMPDGHGGEKEYTCQPVYRLLITSIRGCRLLETITGLGAIRGNAKYLSNLGKEGYAIKLNAVFTHLEELPNEDAYCLTVDSEDHAWTVNGFITHNTEITLNTSNDEIAVCNLGSINLPQHITNGKLDLERLEKTVRIAVRMLDNVVDINFYPVPQAERSNKRHRPVGLGIMGFQDALYKQGIAYNSDAAVEFADVSMEYVSYFAISASADLAQVRGSYETFAGSKWSEGLLPIDTVDILRAARPAGMMEMDSKTHIGTAKWDRLRDRVREGMRNSNVMAIAPTATISNICTVSQSIEPTFENLFVKSNLSGEFTIINRYLIDELTKLGLWTPENAALLKAHDGSVQRLDFVPDELKPIFLTAFEMNPKYLLLAAAKRQKWIDQAQSLNLYLAQANGKKLDMIYKMAWLAGLKTTYYLRAKAATTTEKSTGQTHLNAVSAGGDFAVAAPVPKACSISEPDCSACQ